MTTTRRSELTTGSGFVSCSHRSIAPFALSRPSGLAEAVDLVAAGGRPHAGGLDLVRQLRDGRPVGQVVSLARVIELGAVEQDGDRLRIGATVTHATIEQHPLILTLRPDLSAAWRTVGNVRVRRTGTLGGNLMAGVKDYDAAPILAAAGADLVFVGDRGAERRCSVSDARPEGLLVRVEIPTSGAVVFDRSLKPVVSVAAGTGAIAVGCAHPELAVIPRPDRSPAEAAAAVAELVPDPLDDADASATYRRRMIEVLARRALQRLEDQEGEAR